MRAKTFDDVLLVPQYSDVDSRHNVDLSGNKLGLAIPIISANMDTVTEENMAIAMHNEGGMGIIHRFLSTKRLNQIVSRCKANGAPVCISIGINKGSDEHIAATLSMGVKMFCVDVAHGHHKGVGEAIKRLRAKTDYDPAIIIIAGNVATADGAVFLAEAGVNIIKIGVGSGGICTTRIKTGHGVPQVTAIQSIKERMVRDFGDIELIADGGIRNSGDMAKALVAGADYVMIGGLLAGADETPGDTVTINGAKMKKYRGMASLDAQIDMGRSSEKIIEEGVSMYKPYQGSVRDIIRGFKVGLASALSYSGCHTMSDFKERAIMIDITSASYIESTAHGKQK